MKVYQCIRAYDPYLDIFEKKYKVNENNYTFSELLNLIIKDGFASTYILKPGFEADKDFFYTLWNYKTLQYKWAEEKGLKTRDLDEIRVAQIEEFKPDVYYNFSPHKDNKTLNEILRKRNLIKVCWDATVVSLPPFHENYNLRATLFEPFATFWKQHGYSSFLLPPAFPQSWSTLDQDKKDIDVLFYGQFNEDFFSSRNRIIHELINWSSQQGYKFELHLQFTNKKRALINVRGLKKLTRWLPVAPASILKYSMPPIYGQQLYETIARSKIVVNAFGNFNGLYKDNMRNYESIGCGAILISEEGIYPKHFIPNKDFFTYKNNAELFRKIQQVLVGYEKVNAENLVSKEKLMNRYSKEEQWSAFQNAINSLA